MTDESNDDLRRMLEAQEPTIKDQHESFNDIKLLLAQLLVDKNTWTASTNNAEANPNANAGGGHNANAEG
ncbi:hypothetical protein, partial [Alteromonas stellipolaris]|uniref:hypothetical protein n=1 Tax=Alteromonas stellipolaris TaxID=233316 RepID=UPI001D9E574A